MLGQPLNKGDYDPDEEHYDRSLSNEAQRVVKEISFGVSEASVSNVLENNDSIAYINIKTLENECWCIELTACGYLIVSKEFDKIDWEFNEENLNNFDRKFESIEALMFKISPEFLKKFNQSVAEKLAKIN